MNEFEQDFENKEDQPDDVVNDYYIAIGAIHL